MLVVVPMSLREANEFVESYHRHNGRTSRDGGKFAIGASTGDELVGVAIVGRPLAAALQDGWTAEVLRTCTLEDAPKGSNSFLYARCWRVWREMGGRRLITYTLASESGASLRGAGWTVISESQAHNGWNRPNIGRLRRWQPIYGQLKFRWEISDGGSK
jgi:hypothetical protein